MRSSEGTNFGLARSVVSHTKSRIACLADPSFHDGNGPLEAVWADAKADKAGADEAGSNANVVSKVRRSMPERRMASFMFGFSSFRWIGIFPEVAVAPAHFRFSQEQTLVRSFGVAASCRYCWKRLFSVANGNVPIRLQPLRSVILDSATSNQSSRTYAGMLWAHGTFNEVCEDGTYVQNRPGSNMATRARYFRYSSPKNATRSRSSSQMPTRI
jgi:hypothetical protein